MINADLERRAGRIFCGFDASVRDRCDETHAILLLILTPVGSRELSRRDTASFAELRLPGRRRQNRELCRSQTHLIAPPNWHDTHQSDCATPDGSVATRGTGILCHLRPR